MNVSQNKKKRKKSLSETKVYRFACKPPPERSEGWGFMPKSVC